MKQQIFWSKEAFLNIASLLVHILTKVMTTVLIFSGEASQIVLVMAEMALFVIVSQIVQGFNVRILGGGTALSL